MSCPRSRLAQLPFLVGRFLGLVLCILAVSLPARAETRDFDIVVYGGTSGGITAAVQGARMGKSVVLISPTTHLGGLSTSGLGLTDLGQDAILGGLSREFYHRLYVHYQSNSAWNWQTRSSYTASGQNTPAFNNTTQIASVFEPKVAEAIFSALLSEHAVPVIRGRLDLDIGVVMEGARITALRLEDGRVYRGRMFIDATYEGDLLPGAGVSFTVGREANTLYGETIDGVQVARSSGNQLPNGIDPYLQPGVPASGLLPGLEATAPEPDGTGDHRLQAYCYRMVLTDVAANRRPIAQPAGYDERDYELLFRAIAAGQTSGFFRLSLMPNRKTDSNNQGGISTDYIGKNYGPDWDWTTLDHDQRDALAAAHERWQRGLVWTVQNHARVPSTIRSAYAAWGLPADEFTDNNNWPYQLYVREARRMVSDYVMTQRNCTGSVVAADSAGLAAYTMDSHHTRRHLRGGMVKNEGDVQVSVPARYPVSYRSLVPRAGECENLLVPWSLSATHIAFGSIRMEPVFMILGQSAATAACLALDDNVSVQNLDYRRLRAQLLADDQRLGSAAADPDTIELVVDNADSSGVEIEGTWISSSSVTGYQGVNYLTDNNAGKGPASYVRFTPSLPASGDYAVYLRWTTHANRASNVPVAIQHASGTASVPVNQRTNGNTWALLGTHSFSAGNLGSVTVGTTGTDGYVIADAVRFVATSARPVVSLWTVDAQAREPLRLGAPAHAAEVALSRSGPTTAPLTVSVSLGGSADTNSDYAAPIGSVTIPAGASIARFSLTPAADNVIEGDETVEVSLNAGAAYLPGTLHSATIVIHDRPFDAWKHAQFTQEQQADPTQSGDLADPDADGVPNLLEYALSRHALGFDFEPATTAARTESGTLELTFLRARAELSYLVEVSEDLATWSTLATNPGIVRETAVVPDPASADAPRRFMRLRVSFP